MSKSSRYIFCCFVDGVRMSLSEVFVLFSLLTWCSAYNIDVKTINAVIKEGIDNTNSSLFGYSLTLHSGKSFSKKPTIFVGAPLGDQDHGADVGDIFECQIEERSDVCGSIRVDSTGENDGYKKYEWLGAVVFSNGEGPVITCAPRFSEVDGTGNKQQYFMIGKCFILPEKHTKYPTLYPCTTKAANHVLKDRHDNGFCEAGISAVFRLHSFTAVIGAIGANDQRGDVIMQNKPKETKPLTFAAQSDSGFYLGYAVTYGHFFSTDESKEDIAASIPRIEFSGKVNIYTPDLSKRDSVYPPERVKQREEHIYFGASLCAVDVNGDGYSDLIVGAPFYSTENGGDEGRVYVYLSYEKSGNRKFTLSSGEDAFDPGLRGDNTPGARFGWSIAKAGDLNYDSYDDFIVGAPQNMPDIDGDGFGNGAVYIYHGRKDGRIEEYQQKITAETVAHYYPAFSQFGYAVTGNVDTNGDEYPDIAVGAWQSERVIVLRTRPVMYMTATLSLTKQQIPVGNFTPNCGKNLTGQCLDAEICFTYRGKSVTGRQEIKFTFELDKEISSLAYKRVYLLEGGRKVYKKTENLILTDKNKTNCANFSQIHVEEGNRLTEALSRGTTDIVFYAEYELISPPECENITLCPVLDQSQTHSVSEKATLVFNCSDNTCDYDLQVKISLDKEDITIGTKEKLIATIELSNKDEISYNPEIRISHDPSLQYEKITVPDKSYRIDRRTVPSQNDTVSELFRLVGPLDRNKKIVFMLQYATDKVLGSKKELHIDVKATGASGQEKNDKDNNATASVSVKREVIMEVTGTSQPKLLNYPAVAPILKMKNGTDFSSVNVSDIGPTVKVIVELSNKGKSDLESFQFHISYPLKKAKGKEYDYIVYPISVVADGSGTCNTVNNNILNPENLPLDNVKTRKRRDVQTLKSRNTKRGTFVCNINELKKDSRFIVTFELRLWTRTLVQYYASDLVVKVEALAEYIDKLTDKKTSATGAVDILVSPENPPGKSKSTPVWVVIVAVLGGVLLLAIAILALFKLGFFKRNRPPQDISSPQTDDAPPVAAT